MRFVSAAFTSSPSTVLTPDEDAAADLILAGRLGLWRSDDFVIYYRSGRVPEPWIIVRGRVIGDVPIFNRPAPITVQTCALREALNSRTRKTNPATC